MTLTAEQIGIAAAFASSVVAIADSRRQAFNATAEHRERFAKLEVKVDTLWTFLLRRAEVEATTSRLADRNSPLQALDSGIALFAALAPQLQSFYRTEGTGLSNADLALQIEQRFGRQITDTICTPNSLTFGGCLIVAVAVATGNPVVELP